MQQNFPENEFPVKKLTLKKTSIFQIVCLQLFPVYENFEGNQENNKKNQLLIEKNLFSLNF